MSDGIMVSATIWFIGWLYTMAALFGYNDKVSKLSIVEYWASVLMAIVVWPTILGYWSAGDD